MPARETLRIGTVLFGYYIGDFGDDGPKRVEAIGSDWVVLRDNDGLVFFKAIANPDDLMKFSKPPEE